MSFLPFKVPTGSKEKTLCVLLNVLTSHHEDKTSMLYPFLSLFLVSSSYSFVPLYNLQVDRAVYSVISARSVLLLIKIVSYQVLLLPKGLDDSLAKTG